MRPIRIDFTIAVDDEHAEALAELAQATDWSGIADFLRYEAQEHVALYLEGNGIPLQVTRSNGARWGA